MEDTVEKKLMQLKRLKNCKYCGKELNSKRYYFDTDFCEQTYNFQRREVEKSTLHKEVVII